MDEKPSYWAIIPASVRYDESISASAKLLYAELSVLTTMDGYCWASNEYFSKLYGVSERVVREWVQQLKDAGHVYVEIEENNKRKIWLVEGGVGKKVPGGWKFFSGGVGKKVPHNNIKINNKNEYNTSPSPSEKTPLAEFTRLEGSSDSLGEKDEEITIVETDDEGNPLMPRWGKSTAPRQRPQNRLGRTKIQKRYFGSSDDDEALLEAKYASSTIIAEMEQKRGRKFTDRMKQYRALDNMVKAGIQPIDIRKRIAEMENDEFWQKRGFDLENVQKSFDKR